MLALEASMYAIVHFVSDHRYRIGAALYDASDHDLRARVAKLLDEWKAACIKYTQAVS